MNDSSIIPFIMSRFVGHLRCNQMPHPFFGLLFTGLIIRTAIAVVVIAAVLWLVWKLGRLADAYTENLRSK
jgi:hypothetical protein